MKAASAIHFVRITPTPTDRRSRSGSFTREVGRAARLDLSPTLSLKFGHETHFWSGVIAHRAAGFW